MHTRAYNSEVELCTICSPFADTRHTHMVAASTFQTSKGRFDSLSKCFYYMLLYECRASVFTVTPEPSLTV